MTETSIHIQNGAVVNREALKKAFSLPDGKYNVVIKRAGRRSNKMNAYYWGCVIDYQQQGFKDIGHELSKEEVHAFNKAEFDYKEIIVNMDTGEIRKIPGSTKVMTNTQMIEFIEKIKQFCAEWLNVVIPDPGESADIWDTIVAEYDRENNATIVK